MSTRIPKNKAWIKKGRIIPLEHTIFTFKEYIIMHDLLPDFQLTAVVWSCQVAT